MSNADFRVIAGMRPEPGDGGIPSVVPLPHPLPEPVKALIRLLAEIAATSEDSWLETQDDRPDGE